MNTEKGIKYIKWVSLFVAVIGLAVCLGWLLDIKILQTILPGYASMKFNTAAVFLILGISFYLITIKRWGVVSKSLNILVVIIACTSLSQYVFDYTLGIDEWGVKDYESVKIHNPYPGRPSQGTLISFIVMGLGFLMIHARDKKLRTLVQYTFHSVTIVSFISILGYLFNVPSFYKLSFITSVALHTAFSLFLFSIAATLINPDLGVTGLFTGNTAGSIIARRLFPRMFVVLLVLGFICIAAQREDFVSAEFSIAIYTSAFIIIALFLIWNTSRYLDVINAKRIKAEKSLIQLNRELEEKVLQRTEKLAEINKDMESFSYSVSHDLRGPLRSIGGYAAMLEEDYGKVLDEDGKMFLTLISKTTLRMGTLIENLLAFSRLGKQDISKSEVDMQVLVDEVWEELLWLREYKGKIEIHPLPVLQADKAMMKQVWINLISNALKYTAKKENPFIEIGVEQHENAAVFYVKDNGAGFDMKYINKLFNVFERLHTSTDFEGNGVGLAIVKRIITKHGGKIWAEGELEKGARFYFSLPR